MGLPGRIDWRIAAPALVICAGVCWGLIGLFSHTLAEAGCDSVQITFVRCSLVTVFLGAFLLVFKRPAFRIAPRDVWMFVGTGVLSIAFFNICYFACIQECGLSLAAILLYTAPCFVVLMSALLFKERMTRQKVVALVIAFVGCLLVIGVGSGTALSLAGVLFGLGSGVGYACYSLFARVALARYEPPTVMFYTFLLASVVLVPFARVDQIVLAGAGSATVLVAMVALAGVSTLVPFACYTVGLEHMETGKASIMAFVEPMVALVIGVAVFQDPLSAMNVAGIACIVFAVALLNLRIGSDRRRGLS